MNRVHATTALLLATTSIASAQNWTQTVPGSTAGIPSVRSWSGMAMEWGRNVSLLFGGYDGTTPTSMGSLGDTWTYSASTNGWTQLQPATSPVARDSHVMAHDVARGVTVMFGGLDTVGSELGDTWEWNGTNWTNRTPAGPSPAARLGATMVYDHARSTCILWGGSNYTLATDYSDTWEWNGTTWTQLVTPTSPPARSGQAMAYDLARNRTVMFGGWDAMGTLLGDTWEWNGATWTQVTATPAPAARLWTAMAYDLSRNTIVLYGGAGVATDFNDTWEFQGSWTQRTTVGAPSARDSHVLAYDVGQNAMVLFGGYDMTSDLHDTWEYTASPSASYVPFGTGCAGSGGVPALQPQNLPTLGTTFRLNVTNLPASGGVAYLVIGVSNTVWNGMPLPLSLTGLGFTGCTAYCSVDAGALLLHNNGTAYWSLSLPNLPTLSGMHFYNQALSLDPLAGNPAGAVLSNAGDGTVR